MAHETEIGFFIEEKESYEKKIIDLGFRFSSQVTQTDIMFDNPNADLWLKKDSKIRLREEKGEACLTFKGAPFIVTDFAKRVEINIEINVNDIGKYKDFFNSIGYPILFQLKKDRIMYEKEDTQIVFDNYPILGWRIEIEGKEEQIQPIANILFPDKKYVFRYLSQYFTDYIEKTGKSIEILKKEYLEQTGFDIGNIEKIFDYE